MSVTVNDYGLDRIYRADIVPMLALFLRRRNLLATMIAFNHPAAHKEVSTKPKANSPVVATNCLRKQLASAMAAMVGRVEIKHMK